MMRPVYSIEKVKEFLSERSEQQPPNTQRQSLRLRHHSRSIFLGPTRVGKSTLWNYMEDRPLTVVKHRGILKLMDLNDDGSGARISSGIDPYTQLPKASNSGVLDLPGLMGIDGTFGNLKATSIVNDILEEKIKTKIIIVISRSYLLPGGSLMDFALMMGSIIGQDQENATKWINSSMIVFTDYPLNSNESLDELAKHPARMQQLLASSKQDALEALKEKLNSHVLRFDQEHELQNDTFRIGKSFLDQINVDRVALFPAPIISYYAGYEQLEVPDHEDRLQTVHSYGQYSPAFRQPILNTLNSASFAGADDLKSFLVVGESVENSLLRCKEQLLALTHEWLLSFRNFVLPNLPNCLNFNLRKIDGDAEKIRLEIKEKIEPLWKLSLKGDSATIDSAIVALQSVLDVQLHTLIPPDKYEQMIVYSKFLHFLTPKLGKRLEVLLAIKGKMIIEELREFLTFLLSYRKFSSNTSDYSVSIQGAVVGFSDIEAVLSILDLQFPEKLEITVNADKIFVIDSHVTAPGCSISIVANSWTVKKDGGVETDSTYIIDISGKDAVPQYPDNKMYAITNFIGKDGVRGENGGDLKFSNPPDWLVSKMRIFTNGGKGGDGQYGRIPTNEDYLAAKETRNLVKVKRAAKPMSIPDQLTTFNSLLIDYWGIINEGGVRGEGGSPGTVSPNKLSWQLTADKGDDGKNGETSARAFNESATVNAVALLPMRYRYHQSLEFVNSWLPKSINIPSGKKEFEEEYGLFDKTLQTPQPISATEAVAKGNLWNTPEIHVIAGAVGGAVAGVAGAGVFAFWGAICVIRTIASPNRNSQNEKKEN